MLGNAVSSLVQYTVAKLKRKITKFLLDILSHFESEMTIIYLLPHQSGEIINVFRPGKFYSLKAFSGKI